MKDLDKTIRRSQQYWFDDGLAELLIGVLFMIIGLLFWWQITAAPPLITIVGAIALPFVILAGSRLMGRALRWLKQRLVYPRTGYVTYQKPTEKQRNIGSLIGASAALVGAFVAVAVILLDLAELTAAIIGAGIGVGLFAIGFRMGLRRFHLLAMWAVAVGVLISFFSVETTFAATLALELIGLSLVVSGGFVFWRYWQNSDPGNDEPAEVLS